MSYNSLLGLASHSVDANLQADWPCQETTGLTIDDRSGNMRDATFIGEATNLNTTTGPNGYLTSAIAFDGIDDYVSYPTTANISGADARTYGFWTRAPAGASSRIHDSGEDNTNPSVNGRALLISRAGAGDDQLRFNVLGHAKITGVNSWPDDTWIYATLRVNAGAADSDDIDLLIDGVNQALSTDSGSLQTLITFNDNHYWGAAFANGSFISYQNMDICGVSHFSRALSDAEVLEIASGPEPENTVAPTVSGDTAQGATLTCNPGTWALPSPFSGGTNGTITYTYQWTRDGSDISGATSSTYVTQAVDIGTAVGCKVLGVNDGGSDTAEQTASSNTISVVASGTTYRMNMRLSMSNSIGV